MKKLLAVTFATTMVLGLAGIASAVHIEAPAESSSVVAMGGLITLDGDVRNRFVAKQGIATDSSTIRGNDLRVRLGATVKTSDATTGRILLENGSDSIDFEGWGNALSTLNTGGDKKGGLNILEAWAQYAPGNGGVKVGHMPLALGNKIFFDHTGSGDDAVVAFFNPNESTHVAGLFIKFFDESTTTTADESDIQGYVGLATFGLADGMKLGANWTHLDSKGSEMRFNNIGLNLDGKVGEIGFKLDGEKQFGDLSTTVDASGWAAQGEVSVGLGEATVGALVGYGTGDDDPLDDDQEGFVNFLTDTRYQSTMFGYIVAVPGMGGQKNTGLSNLQLYQVNAAVKTKCPVTGKDLSLSGRVNYAKLNETESGQEDDLGTEVELFATWKLDAGLSFGFEGAYLFAGDAYNTETGVTNDDPENPWFTRASLSLSF
jgi:hypothetical protein